MFFGAALIASILVGAMAQKWKGRTGAAWGFLTFLYCAVAWIIVLAAADPVTLHAPTDQQHQTRAFTAVFFGAGFMVFIVMTLPKR